MNYFPQYTLDDLRTGRLSVADFRLLVGGMLDNVAPDATEPRAEKIRRQVADAAAAAHERAKNRKGW